MSRVPINSYILFFFLEVLATQVVVLLVEVLVLDVVLVAAGRLLLPAESRSVLLPHDEEERATTN